MRRKWQRGVARVNICRVTALAMDSGKMQTKHLSELWFSKSITRDIHGNRYQRDRQWEGMLHRRAGIEENGLRYVHRV